MTLIVTRPPLLTGAEFAALAPDMRRLRAQAWREVVTYLQREHDQAYHTQNRQAHLRRKP